jgi:acetyl-CoA acyltransferase
VSTPATSILGAAMTDMSWRDRSPDQLAGQAVLEALCDAGIDPKELGLVVSANATGGRLNDQGCIRGQTWLRTAGLGDVAIVNVDNSCAGGSSALQLGVLAAGALDRPVLVVGVEKMWTGDRQATLEGIEAGLAADYRSEMHARLREDGNPARSILMGVNAAWADEYMTERGGTVEQIAAAAVKARAHGALNPNAQFREPVAMDAVLSSPQIAGVLTRYMCSSFTDGAAALVLANEPRAGAPTVATIVGSVARSGNGTTDYHHRLAMSACAAYEEFGLGPSDFDLVELHDATSAEELYALECLGFFGPGEAGPATAVGDTSVGGAGVTVNPSGGLVARGHPLAATGLAQVVEVVTQLRGAAGSRQVANARHGLTVNTGGIIDGDPAYLGFTAIKAVNS